MRTFEEAWELAKETGEVVGFGEHVYLCCKCGKDVKLLSQKVGPNGKTQPTNIDSESVRCFDCVMGAVV